MDQILEQAWGLPDPVSGLKPRAGFIPALNMSTNKYGYVNRDFLKDMKPGPGTWMPGPPPNSIPAVAAAFWDPPKIGEQIQPAGASKKKRKKGPVPNPNQKRIDELARQPIPGTSKTSTTSNEAKIIQLKAKANKLLKVAVSLNKQYPNKIAFQQILKDLKEISKYNPSQDETVTESSKHLERFERIIRDIEQYINGIPAEIGALPKQATKSEEEESKIKIMNSPQVISKTTYHAIRGLEDLLNQVTTIWEAQSVGVTDEEKKQMKKNIDRVHIFVNSWKEKGKRGKFSQPNSNAYKQVSKFETILMKIEKFINNQEEMHRLETEGKKGADNDGGKGGTTKEPGDGPVQLNPEKVNDGNGGKGLIAKNNTPGDGKGGTKRSDPRVKYHKIVTIPER